MWIRLLCLLGGCGLWAASATAADATNRNTTPERHAWPQWRGPLANGVAPFANPPTHWSETNHVRWKVALPGKGHSSPIVWGDRIFLMAAVPVGDAQKPVYDNAPG